MIAMLSFLPAAVVVATTVTPPMSLPVAFAPVEVETSLTGFAGRRDGRFTAGAVRGSFERTARPTFRLLEDGPLGPMSAECEAIGTVRAPTRDASALGEAPAGQGWRCVFRRDGEPLDAQLDVTVPSGAVDGTVRGAASGSSLVGRFTFGGLSLTLRGEPAADAGAEAGAAATEGASSTGLLAPAWRFERDGRAIGTVQLAGTPRLLTASTASVSERRMALLAALSLALIATPG